MQSQSTGFSVTLSQTLSPSRPLAQCCSEPIYVIRWVWKGLAFYGMISLGEGKGKTNSSKSQIKEGSEFVISSAHKYSSCYPSVQSKKARIL